MHEEPPMSSSHLSCHKNHETLVQSIQDIYISIVGWLSNIKELIGSLCQNAFTTSSSLTAEHSESFLGEEGKHLKEGKHSSIKQ